MIARSLWYAGVFCLSVWIGAHSTGFNPAVPTLDRNSTVPKVGNPFHELARVLGG